MVDRLVRLRRRILPHRWPRVHERVSLGDRTALFTMFVPRTHAWPFPVFGTYGNPAASR